MHPRYIIIAFLCPVVTAVAQSHEPKPLTIGDRVPDIHFTTVANYSYSSVHLSDFKGKLVILDFWATWCTSCLRSFPKMDSLQKEFKDRLRILLINSKNTGDDYLKVHAFFKRWKTKFVNELHLPSAVNDTIADKLFKHQLIPHYVWISAEGKVIAITSASQVTAENIRSVIEKGSASFMMKKDQDTEKPIFSGTDLPTTGLLNYAVLVKGMYDGLPGGSRVRRTGNIIHGRAMTNTSLLNIYKMAVQSINDSIADRQILLEVNDPSELLFQFYTLDIIVPVEHADELYPKMLQLLNDYSGYKGRFEKRIVKYLALVRTSPTDLLKTKDVAVENKLWDETMPALKNGTMGMLVARLNVLPATEQLVVDETGYKERFDIVFTSGLNDMKVIQEELGRYGLKLEEKEMEMEVFVIEVASLRSQ